MSPKSFHSKDVNPYNIWKRVMPRNFLSFNHNSLNINIIDGKDMTNDCKQMIVILSDRFCIHSLQKKVLLFSIKIKEALYYFFLKTISSIEKSTKLW